MQITLIASPGFCVASPYGFCRRLHLVPAASPATMDFVRNRIEGVHPKQIGLQPKRWQNILSELRFAIDRYGAEPIGKLRCDDLPAPWRECSQQLPLPDLRYGLSRFIKFCALNRVAPSDVDTDTFEAFATWLVDHSTCPNPPRKARDAVRKWNRAAETIHDWPGRTVTWKPAREAYCLPWQAMPAALQDEAAGWLRSLGEDNWADENAPLRPLRPASIKARQFQIRQAFSILVDRGHDPAAITALAYLVKPDHAEQILSFFWKRSGDKPSSQAAGMAHCLLSLARHRVRLPEQQIRRLQRMKHRVTPRRSGLTDKNRAMLRQFEDERNKESLLMFPIEAMRRAKRMSSQQPIKAARLAQIAVAVEILTMMPIRLSNLTSLHLNRNLEWRGERLFVIISAEAVKNDEAIEFELLGPSIALIREYLDHYRPVLANGTGYLFPGTRPDTAKNATHLARQITKQVFDATGIRLTPHQFRHVAAKIWLDDNPGSYEVVRRILHHRSIDTTTANYTGFETRSAALQYDRFILSQRRRFFDVGGDNNG